MVVVRIIGGLGNQMFQYAAGRRLADVLGTELRFDTLGLERRGARAYGLDDFRVRATAASPADIRQTKFRGRTLAQKIRDRLRNGPARGGPFHVREKAVFRFDPAILALPDNVYLEGSWQNPRYFEDVGASIRRDFSFEMSAGHRDAMMAEQIEDSTSVSVHVRRGDYITDPLTNSFHGTCSSEYYAQAVQWIGERAPDAHFFLFSDDPEWTAAHMQLGARQTVVKDSDGTRASADMHLMSRCKHHIIANSTFSWWGAWLCSHENKLVVAPREWLRDTSVSTDDLLPARWVRL